MQKPVEPKKILCIHDLSGVGRCSLAVILPVLSVMGFQPVALPTVVLSTHTGGLGTPARMDGSAYGMAALEHYQALENSCNQSFIQIGARLGREAFCDYFAAFGLREPTGIDLPAEPKKSLYYTADRMGPVELASCAFGQSSKISYLEMAAAVCAVVNGGKLMQPYVVSEILAPDGSTIEQLAPVCKRQVLKAETSQTMREMMEAVVLHGGGRNAQIPGYRVGGKSGTSQKLDSADEKARIASFVAVAPIDDPQFLCLVCLDEPHSLTTSGGALSGPVCAEVLQKALPYLGIEPTEMVEK